jgi:DNA-binding transcriptional LysR family regulator
MELRHLRYFVAVAEELHFRRAAERLHVAQPAVSEQIRKLELELGVLLLNRTHRAVSLTDAGAAMLEEARRVLRQADVAQQAARQAHNGRAHRLRIGRPHDAFPEAFSRTLGRLGRAAPGIELVLETGTVAQLLDDLRAGRLDLAVVCLPAPVRGLRTIPFAREQTVAAVPLMHRMADSDSIAIEQLSESNLVVLPRAVNPAFYDGVVSASRAAGFAPSLVESLDPRVEQVLVSVATGRGIALLPASAADRFALPGVVFRPLAEPAPACDVALVGPAEPTTAAMQLTKLLRDASKVRREPAGRALAVAA